MGKAEKGGADRLVRESLTKEVMKQNPLEPQDRREQQVARVVDGIHLLNGTGSTYF